MENNPLFDRFQQEITQNDVVLYMKGTAEVPLCGFSGLVAGVLNRMGVSFYSVNVLDDPAVRDGIKVFSDWPTIPQLYIKGDLIGGADIVKDMALSGQLSDVLTDKGIAHTPVNFKASHDDA